MKRMIRVAMREKHMRKVYLVSATNGENTQMWAAATSRENAVAAVRQKTGAGWQVSLTGDELSEDESRIFDIPPGRTRRLKFVRERAL